MYPQRGVQVVNHTRRDPASAGRVTTYVPAEGVQVVNHPARRGRSQHRGGSERGLPGRHVRARRHQARRTATGPTTARGATANPPGMRRRVAPGWNTGPMPSTSPRGRLFGKNVLDGTFRAAPDEDLFIGELLVGVDEATDRRYLFRVVNVTYGSEHREPGWAERVAGTLLADDSRGESGLHPLHEQDRRTYRVAECRCLGYLAPPAPGGGGAPSARCFANPRVCRPSFRPWWRRRPRTSGSWPTEWATCPSASCAAARRSSTFLSASRGRACPPTWGSSPPRGWGNPI